MSSHLPHELLNRVEAVLFAAGRAMEFSEIAKLAQERDDSKVKSALKALQKRYEESETSLVVVEEGRKWKLTVGDKYLPLVRNLVAETELSKTVLETLAVVAWKSPVMQSEVIRIRTNKAYDHIKELEESGFITRQKHGRTMLIKLTEKFHKYFDVEGKRLKDAFHGIKGKGPQDSQLEVYDTAPAADTVEEPERLGQLEIVDEPPEQEPKEHREANTGNEAPAEGHETQAGPEAENEEPKEEEAETDEAAPPQEGERMPFDAIDLDSVDKQDKEEDVLMQLNKTGENEKEEPSEEKNEQGPEDSREKHLKEPQ